MKLQNRRWDIVHRYEEEDRSRFLRTINIDKSFKTLSELYKFVYLTNKNFFRKQNNEKFNILVKSHSIFNKVR